MEEIHILFSLSSSNSIHNVTRKMTTDIAAIGSSPTELHV